MRRLELPRPHRRGTHGVCTGCGRPAFRNEYGWFHLGSEDNAACRHNGDAARFQARPTTRGALALGVGVGVIMYGVAVWTLTTELMGGPLTVGQALAAGLITFPFTVAGTLAAVALFERHRAPKGDTIGD